MTPKLLALVIAVEALAGSALGLRSAWARSHLGQRLAVEQPLPFDHAVHRFTCTVCHAGATSKVQAGLPGVDTCMKCHNSRDERKPGPLTDRIREADSKGEAIQWLKYTKVPGHVYFSHLRHGRIGKVECRECHGDVGRSTMKDLEVVEQTMNACMGCHEERGASLACLGCHK